MAAALRWLLVSCAITAPGDAPRRAGTALAAPVVERYCRHRTPTDAELARLRDAVRLRALVIAARTLARSIEAGEAPEPVWAWSGGYVGAEVVVERAGEVVGGAIRRRTRLAR